MTQKPSWAKTNVDWSLKIAIWERMAHGDTNNGVGVWLDTQEYSLNRDTVAAVRNELSECPEELISELPTSVQVYWNEKHRKNQLTQGRKPTTPMQEEAYDRCQNGDYSWMDEQKFEGVAFTVRSVERKAYLRGSHSQIKETIEAVERGEQEPELYDLGEPDQTSGYVMTADGIAWPIQCTTKTCYFHEDHQTKHWSFIGLPLR